MSDVFVSHAVADQPLAEMLVDFLIEAVGVPAKRIFCSSLPGHGIPLTHDFNATMQKEIQQAKLVILLMSPSYMDSQFCLMELGATWAAGLKPLPIVVPPVAFDAVTKTLGLKQAWQITDATMLQGVRETLLDVLELEGAGNYQFDRKRARWERDLPAMLANLAPAPKVSRDSYAAVEEKNRGLEATIAHNADEIKELKRRVKSLGALRPAVLVIEHEPQIALDLTLMLEDLGYVVGGIARTETEAVEMAARFRPDIVTAETVLADGSSGISAVNKIMALADVAAIFVTAFPERLLTGTARPEPTSLITKPYTQELLGVKLEEGYGDLLIRRRKAALSS